MRKSLIAVVAAVACVVLAPASAFAASAPKFSSKYIVPNRSLGGLKLNAPASSATKIFGAKECTTGGCSYTAPGQSWSLNVIFAAKTATSKPYIGQINLSVTKTSSSSVLDLRTASGIGIGSSAAATKKAYPHLLGNSQELYTSTKLPLTVYGFTDGRLSSISLRSVQLG